MCLQRRESIWHLDDEKASSNIDMPTSIVGLLKQTLPPFNSLLVMLWSIVSDCHVAFSSIGHGDDESFLNFNATMIHTYISRRQPRSSERASRTTAGLRCIMGRTVASSRAGARSPRCATPSAYTTYRCHLQWSILSWACEAPSDEHDGGV